VTTVTTTLAEAIRVLHERARKDDLVAETVVLLAQDLAEPVNPFGEPPPGLLAMAQRVNERRQRRRSEAFRGRSLDSGQVVHLVTSINDRRGVDRRRQRGRLLGWRVGRKTLHPEWQFDRRLRDTRPGLDRLLTALREVAPDPLAADALMTVPREDLDGGTLADLFAAGRLDTVIRLVLASGDQS
jgi:hypothetical protein